MYLNDRYQSLAKHTRHYENEMPFEVPEAATQSAHVETMMQLHHPSYVSCLKSPLSHASLIKAYIEGNYPEKSSGFLFYSQGNPPL